MRTSFLFAYAWAALGLACAQVPGQMMSGSASSERGPLIRFVTAAEPPITGAANLKFGSMGVTATKDRVHRYLIDDTHQTFFGYDIDAKAMDAGNQFQVTIEPLSWTPRELKTRKGDPLTPVFLPKYPPPQLVHEGDTIVLDLLVSPDGKQKVVDYIQISANPQMPRPGVAGAPSRDFTPDDAPLQFEFGGRWSLWINGKPFPEIGFTRKTGSTLWLSLPGQGRYILSLAPRTGYDFERAGTLLEDAIAFQADGNRYEMRLSNPIVHSAAAWNVYLLHDPRYKSPAESQAIYAGVDRLENLLPNAR